MKIDIDYYKMQHFKVINKFTNWFKKKEIVNAHLNPSEDIYVCLDNVISKLDQVDFVFTKVKAEPKKEKMI